MAAIQDDFLNLRQTCDGWLRQGRFALAQKELKKLSANAIPRHHLADLSALARRAHLWQLSLRWLHPIVRPKVKGLRPANGRETMEYALALQRAGALPEADQLLGSVDSEKEPRVLLSRGYVSMARWDYGRAETFLSRYVLSGEISDYERAIGRVNWLATLVFLDDARVPAELAKLAEDLRSAGHQLLLSNCLELTAQHAIKHERWADAEKTLDEARRLVDADGNLDALFIAKGRAIADALKSGRPDELYKFRARALKQSHWETLRDLDFYIARLEPSAPWAEWVYYGTPHLAFRKRLEAMREFADEQWVCRTTNFERSLDPWFPGFQEDGLSHRAFVLLLRDLYRPLRVGEAFSELFPDQYYDPDSSPNRVHQVMSRTKKWIEGAGLSLSLTTDTNSYSLRLDEQTRILFRKKLVSFEETRFIFDRYGGRLGPEFTSEDCARLMQLSLSGVKRLIKRALEQKLIERSGRGKKTVYYLCAPPAQIA